MTRRKHPVQDENSIQSLKVILPSLKIADPSGIEWTSFLTPDGFRTEVSISTKNETIILGNTMPWDAFIHGLAHGWQKYHQSNPGFTEAINDFIKEQIENSNYTV